MRALSAPYSFRWQAVTARNAMKFPAVVTMAQPVLHWLLVSLLLLGCQLPACAEDFRLWTDSSNRRLEAALVDVRDGEVTLKKRDGKVLPIGVINLGPADQDYIKKWKADVQKPEVETIARAQPASPIDMRPWPDTVSAGTEIAVETIQEDKDDRLFIYRTQHFEFRSDARLGANVVKDFGRLFESTYFAVKSLPLDLKPVPSSGYFVTRLFEDKGDYHKSGGPRGSGGLYVPSAQSILVPLDSLGVKRLGSRYTIESREDNQVLIHEITHQVMHRWFGLCMPVWLAEGFADLMASSRYRMGRFGFVRQSDNIAAFLKLREVVKDKDKQAPIVLTPLADLTKLSYTQWASHIHLRNYTSSLLLTYYFCKGDGAGDGADLNAYLRALESGVPEFAARSRFLFRDRSASQLEADVTRFWHREGLEITFGGQSTAE